MVIGQIFKKISIYKYFYYILNEMSISEEVGGNKSKAAEILGLDRKTLYKPGET
jgi:DNA-binding protein Fis